MFDFHINIVYINIIYINNVNIKVDKNEHTKCYLRLFSRKTDEWV